MPHITPQIVKICLPSCLLACLPFCLSAGATVCTVYSASATPLLAPFLSHQGTSSVPSRPVPSPLLSRRVAPCCPVPSSLLSRPVPSSLLSRRVAPLLSRRVGSRRPSRPFPSASRFLSRPVTRAPCALPVCHAPAAPCPSVVPGAPCPSVAPRAPCPSVAPHAPCLSVAPPLRPARPSRPVRPACLRLSRPVLHFDAEGRPLEFSVWLLRARRLLESQVQAHETLWAHASDDLPEPADHAPLAADPTLADSDHYACERADVTAWKSRDAAACIALSILLPESEETHFTQVRMASEFLTAIKACYATPTTVSLGRLFLPFLFPDLASFECTADLITHLHSLDSSYCATCTDAQLALLPPPMAITIYFIATSLPDRLASVHGALLLKHPSKLTIEVLELALKDVKSNLRSVASAAGVVPPPFFHGCTVPQLPTFTASLATAATDVTAAAVRTSSQSRGRSGRRGGQGAGTGGGGGGGDVASGGDGSAGAGGAPRAAAGDALAAAGGGDARVRQPPTGLRAVGGGAVAWYLTRRQQQQQQPLPSQQPQQQQRQKQVSGQGSRQRPLQRGVVHPPCTYHVLTGACRSQPCGRSHPLGQCFAQLTDTVRLAYGIDGPVPDWLPLVRTYGPTLWGMSASQLVDLFGTPHAMYALVGCSASDSVYLSVLCLGGSLAEVPVARVGTCVDTSPRAALEDALLSFTLDLELPTVSSATARHLPRFLRRLWSLHTSHWPPRAAATAAAAAAAAAAVAAAAVAAAATAPDPCHCPPSGSRVSPVFPLAKKSDVTSTLIQWLLTTAVTRGCHVSCLHSDRGGEFRSGILAGFCRKQGIRQSWTLPESPQQNGVAECRIGLVMEIARTSMTHARGPHVLWPYAVRYAAHQLNLWPRVSRPEVSPTSLWTRSPGAASCFRVWGCLALVCDTSADKILPRAISWVFLGFPEDSSDYIFYHPPLHRFFDSRDVRFNESAPYYIRYPCRGLPVPPAPLFLTSAPPPAPPV
ncbi:unnamed protein product [Closterium sp. NIES-54]